MAFFLHPDVDALKAAASNVVDGAPGAYTEAMFYADFPQFRDAHGDAGFVPTTVMQTFLNMCNAAVSPDRWFETWRLAAGIFVAHYVTLYLRSNQGNTRGSINAAKAAESGGIVGVVSSASLGDASVSYDTSAATQGTVNWGQFNLTSYGQQFASMARLVALGGSYIF